MREPIAHHGQFSSSVQESESHTETQRVLATSADGRLEEWIMSVRRMVERIVTEKFVIVRQLIHIRISVRRVLSQERAPERSARIPGAEETYGRMLSDAGRHLDAWRSAPQPLQRPSKPRQLTSDEAERSPKQATPLMLAA